MKEDMETQLHTIDLYVRNLLDDMKSVTKASTKGDMLAHIDAWTNEVQTIKYIIDL